MACEEDTRVGLRPALDAPHTFHPKETDFLDHHRALSWRNTTESHLKTLISSSESNVCYQDRRLDLSHYPP